MKVRMSVRERALFEAFASRSKGYFEFGIGGSTVLAATLVEGPVVAVDSDPAWIAQARASLPASAHPRRLVHVDIGPLRDWGLPASDAHRAQFPNYAAAIRAAPEAIDLCLVDGRFRIACFLQALLRLPADAVIGLHDYRSRARYHVVEAFARPIAEAEDITFFVARPERAQRSLLSAMRGRPGRFMRSVERALEAYAYDPS